MAYHTPDLEKIKRFYGQLLGLEVIGSFEDHEGFSGVFLGREGQTWHLEFTTSVDAEKAEVSTEALMVFYHETQADYEKRMAIFEEAGVSSVPANNPYWETWGTTYLDPDGRRIVLCKKKW
jgi:catechol 2,3-dioxygenase-like lactoylglutathione lyase family enzyme